MQLWILHALSTQLALALSREHLSPHPPQLKGFVFVLVSQPLVGSPSQSSNPGRHGPRTHLLASQAGSALGKAAQALPHFEQFFGSVVVATSQPSLALPLQSANPLAQPPDWHTPPAQSSMLPAIEQALSQVPQCAGSSFKSAQVDPQHSSVLGHPRAVEQPEMQRFVRPSQTVPSGQFASLAHPTHWCVARSHRKPVAPSGLAPPSPGVVVASPDASEPASVPPSVDPSLARPATSDVDASLGLPASLGVGPPAPESFGRPESVAPPSADPPAPTQSRLLEQPTSQRLLGPQKSPTPQTPLWLGKHCTHVLVLVSHI